MLLRAHIDKASWQLLMAVTVLHIAATWLLLLAANETELLGLNTYFYYYVVTTSTVGYGDMSAVTPLGRWVVALFQIPFGLALFGVLLGKVGQLVTFWVKRAMTGNKNLAHLTDHIVIFGWHEQRTKKIVDYILADNKRKDRQIILVSKDINMRLKARGFGVEAQDYHNDQLVDDIDLLPSGYMEFKGSFWDTIEKVETVQREGLTEHILKKQGGLERLNLNEFIIDEQGFIGRVSDLTDEQVILQDLSQQDLLNQEAWGLIPRDLYQGLALNLLLNPDIHLVNLTGAAGSGKTILALAAAIEMTVASKRYKRIIATRSIQGLDEDIGFLPGTEEEKMEPWLGAISDNLEALHNEDECTDGSLDYLLQKVPLQFKSLNYMRGRSFQQSIILIDESQNLTPHQIKTIITRAGTGSKVVCLGNLSQIDTAYMNPISSGLTYLTARFRQFPLGGTVQLQGVPRSQLAEFAEQNL